MILGDFWMLGFSWVIFWICGTSNPKMQKEKKHKIVPNKATLHVNVMSVETHQRLQTWLGSLLWKGQNDWTEHQFEVCDLQNMHQNDAWTMMMTNSKWVVGVCHTSGKIFGRQTTQNDQPQIVCLRVNKVILSTTKHSQSLTESCWLTFQTQQQWQETTKTSFQQPVWCLMFQSVLTFHWGGGGKRSVFAPLSAKLSIKLENWNLIESFRTQVCTEIKIEMIAWGNGFFLYCLRVESHNPTHARQILNLNSSIFRSLNKRVLFIIWQRQVNNNNGSNIRINQLAPNQS